MMLARPGDQVIRLPDFVCFELKWLKADEFAHWSHTDFKARINARKRREWALFHALREGSSLPDHVVLEGPVACLDGRVAGDSGENAVFAVVAGSVPVWSQRMTGPRRSKC